MSNTRSTLSRGESLGFLTVVLLVMVYLATCVITSILTPIPVVMAQGIELENRALAKPSWERCIVDGVKFNCITLEESKNYLNLYVEYKATRSRYTLLEKELTLTKDKVKLVTVYSDKLRDRGDKDTKLIENMRIMLVEEVKASYSLYSIIATGAASLLIGILTGYIFSNLPASP